MLHLPTMPGLDYFFLLSLCFNAASATANLFFQSLQV